MSNIDAIKVKLKEAFEFSPDEKISCTTAFKIASDVLEQYQSEQKQSAVWVVKSHTSSIADTGDYYTQYYLENEGAGKNLFLSSDDEEDYLAMADYLNTIPQKQLTDEETHSTK